jgi:hypothetical protein
MEQEFTRNSVVGRTLPNPRRIHHVRVGGNLAKNTHSKLWHDRGKKHEPCDATALRQQRQEHPAYRMSDGDDIARARANPRGDHIGVPAPDSVRLVHGQFDGEGIMAAALEFPNQQRPTSS